MILDLLCINLVFFSNLEITSPCDIEKLTGASLLFLPCVFLAKEVSTMDNLLYCHNGGCKLTFLYIESLHKCTLGPEIDVVNMFVVKNV